MPKGARNWTGWRFTFRQILIGLVIAMLGILVIVPSVGPFLLVDDDLGRREQAIPGPVPMLYYDGEVLGAVHDERYTTWNADGDRLARFGRGEFLIGPPGLAQHPRWGDSGLIHVKYIGENTIIDLRSGSTHSVTLPETFVPHALVEGRLLGTYNGSLAWQDADSEAGELERIDRPQGTQSLDPPSIQAADENGAVGWTRRGNESYIEIWPFTGEDAKSYGPVERAPERSIYGFEGSHMALTDDTILFLSFSGDGVMVTALDRLTMAIKWEIVTGWDVGSYLMSDGQNWVAGRLVAGGTGTDLAKEHAFVFGSNAGQVHLRHSFPVQPLVYFQGSMVYPARGGLLYWDDDHVWYAWPGEGPPASAYLRVAGGSGLVLAGLAWPVVARVRLHRAAAGGARRCLNCGAMRPAKVAFCPRCGWRTEDEEAVANVKKKPWEYER